MTTLLKNASYLKVSHSGQTTGSLLLADLADEENAKQEKKIPVYVPENGSITIPLDEDVLLSYQQGTIRGLEDQGYVSTELLDNRNTAEIWVSPEGDDSNPGTEQAPYASIQKAIDDLVDEFGHDVHKKVRFKTGTYGSFDNNQPYIYVQTKNIEFIGPEEPTDTPNTLIQGFPWVITNMTRTAFEGFISDGGLGLSVSGSEVTMSHADLNQRDRVAGLSSDDAYNIVFRNIYIFASGEGILNGVNPAVTAVFTNDTDGGPYIAEGFHFDNCTFAGQEADDDFTISIAAMYFRTCEDVTLDNCDVVAPNTNQSWLIFDNCLYIEHIGESKFAPTVLAYYDETDVVPPDSGGGARTFGSTTCMSAEIRDFIIDVTSGVVPTFRTLHLTGELRLQTEAILYGITLNDISGPGDLTMNGGGYSGTNSLSGTFTYNALGTT